MINILQFETERLVLKQSKDELSDQVLKFVIRNKEFWSKTEPRRTNNYYTLEYQISETKKDIELYDRSNQLKFYFFKKEDEKNIIGMVNLSSIVLGTFRSAFLGYKLDWESTGYGYMQEAIKKIIEIAFYELKLHRIEANIMPRNIPSLNVVSNLGFINEGISKKYLFINGSWEDHFHMVLLNEALEKDEDFFINL